MWAVMQSSGLAQAEGIPALENRLNQIDSRLEVLPAFSMRHGLGSVGCESVYHQDPNHLEWVQVNLKEATKIDKIILVPTLWRDSEKGIAANGFPLKFKVIAGIGESSGSVIASFDESDQLLPRIAPLAIDCSITASWVRIEAELLSQRKIDQSYLLALSELFLFDGQENVALRQEVTASSMGKQEGGARSKRYLVDGFVPYQMDASIGAKENPYQVYYKKNQEATFTLDLEEARPVDRVQLHAFDSADTIPQAIPDYHGQPQHFVLEGSLTRDFSSPILLADYVIHSHFDRGPILTCSFPAKTIRYLRLSIPPSSDHDSNDLTVVGFSEIEVFSAGENIALGKTFEASHHDGRPIGLLTDGSNLYGKILPIRHWLEQLAERHDLEFERPQIESQLKKSYAKQHDLVQTLSWLIAILVASIVLGALLYRIFVMRKISSIKKRFAADLHDELGANLHAINMLGTLAQDANKVEDLRDLIDHSSEFAQRSLNAVNHCSNMLEAPDLCQDLANDLEHTANRTLADMEHSFSITGREHLTILSQRKRYDLLLFYKECLTNIIRHSMATSASTKITATPTEINLEISDNGIGIHHDQPKSLRRRTRLLRAKLSVVKAENEGTKISLTLKPRKWTIKP